jgi:hypothetical protein
MNVNTVWQRNESYPLEQQKKWPVYIYIYMSAVDLSYDDSENDNNNNDDIES